MGMRRPRIEWENVPKHWSESLQAIVPLVGPGPVPDRGDCAQGVGSGLPQFAEAPRFVVDRPIRDLQLFDFYVHQRDIMLLSERAHTLFRQLDPNAFDSLAVDVRLATGEPGLPYWLCDLTRVIDATDFERSQVETTQTEPTFRYMLRPLHELNVFRRSAVEGVHFFRLLNSPGGIYCDAAAASAIASKPKITGTLVEPAGVVDA